MFCPNCGTKLPDSSKFCDNCGERIEGVQAAPQPVQVKTDAAAPETPYTPPASPKRRPWKLVLIPLALVLVIGIAAAVLLLGREPAEDAAGGTGGPTSATDDGSVSSAAEPKQDEDTAGASDAEEPDEPGEPDAKAPVEDAPPDSEPAQAGNPAVTMANIVDAGATSSLEEYGMSHLPWLAVDGDPATGWVEGAAGSGVGESLHLVLDGTYLVSGFTIWSGYHKSSDLYHKNARPSVLEAAFSDGTTQVFELEDRMEPQTFLFASLVSTDSVVFTIREVCAGNKYLDAVISEIELF